jgi:hypothetical protein
MTETTWRRSSRCAANGACVEVGYRDGATGVVVLTDSADPARPELPLTRDQFAALLDAIKEDR